MTFALVHLECALCGNFAWATIPAVLLDLPFTCGYCEEVSMFPALGEAVHLIPGDSYLVYDWYYRDPERVLQEKACPS